MATSANEPACDRHFQVRTVAERFGVSVGLVYAEMERGALPYLKFGNRRVIPESAILAYIERRAVGDHPQRPLAPPAPRGKAKHA